MLPARWRSRADHGFVGGNAYRASKLQFRVVCDYLANAKKRPNEQVGAIHLSTEQEGTCFTWDEYSRLRMDIPKGWPVTPGDVISCSAGHAQLAYLLHGAVLNLKKRGDDLAGKVVLLCQTMQRALEKTARGHRRLLLALRLGREDFVCPSRPS